MTAFNRTLITIVKEAQMPNVLILKVGEKIFYRVTDIALYLGYKSSIPLSKLKGDYNCNLKTLMEIMQEVGAQKRIIINSKDNTMSKLTPISQFTDFDGFRAIVKGCKRKHGAINAERILNLNPSNKCIQAKIEYLLIPYFKHWNIAYEHEKTVIIATSRYRIDIALPDFRIAIEIDEHGHADRDQVYENNRQMQLEQQGYYFVRLNPHQSRKSLELIVAGFWRNNLWPVLRNRNPSILDARRHQLKSYPSESGNITLTTSHKQNIMQLYIICLAIVVIYNHLRLILFVTYYTNNKI